MIPTFYSYMGFFSPGFEAQEKEVRRRERIRVYIKIITRAFQVPGPLISLIIVFCLYNSP